MTMPFACSFTAKAGEAISANRLVKFSVAADSEDPVTVLMCDAGEDAIGVSRAVAASGDLVTVYLLQGVLLVESGATLAAGAKCYCGANGVLAATGSGPQFLVLEGAASGDLVKVLPPSALANVRGFTANIETLAAAKTLTAADDALQVLDPGGAGRDVLLPPEAEGLAYTIKNAADAAEDLAVKEDGGATTIATVSQNETGIFVCDGTTWHGGVVTIT